MSFKRRERRMGGVGRQSLIEHGGGADIGAGDDLLWLERRRVRAFLAHLLDDCLYARLLFPTHSLAGLFFFEHRLPKRVMVIRFVGEHLAGEGAPVIPRQPEKVELIFEY